LPFAGRWIIARALRGTHEGDAMIDFTQLRRTMVDGQIRVNDVTDPRIIDAMLELPRERFVPEARASLAYLDEDPLVREAAAGRPARYLIEPMAFAKLVQALDLAAGDSVLDVGCATGYSAAVLGRLAGRVIALEQDEELAARARRLLAELGTGNVEVVTGPLAAGAPGKGPYDAILLNGSVEVVPEALFAQLADGGRLGAVVRSGPMGRAILHVRIGGAVSKRPLFDATIPPLPGFAAPRQFVF
jgi:protein-L-isoaspartate(D-aspartate) O-methyltransferase